MSRRKSTDKIIITLIVVVLAIVFSLIGRKLGLFNTDTDKTISDGAFSVHFIDVGQGDCILIKSDKGNMLIDAGENGNESTVLNYLKDHDVTNIKYFVATHSHSDHIGGAAEVIDAVKVENVILSKYSDHDTKTYEKMLEAIVKSKAKTIAAVPGNEYTMGDIKFTILAPSKDDDNLNNTSVVLKLTYGSHSFMFAGDAEKEVEEQLIDSGYDLSADVLKLSHHGSSTSNSPEFLKAVNPEIAVISYGSGNDYGHPHKEVVKLLEKEKINYYSTAKGGNTVIKIDDGKIIVEQEG